jgi:hypothetical protein
MTIWVFSTGLWACFHAGRTGGFSEVVERGIRMSPTVITTSVPKVSNASIVNSNCDVPDDSIKDNHDEHDSTYSSIQDEKTETTVLLQSNQTISTFPTSGGLRTITSTTEKPNTISIVPASPRSRRITHATLGLSHKVNTPICHVEIPNVVMRVAYKYTPERRFIIVRRRMVSRITDYMAAAATSIKRLIHCELMYTLR